MGTSVEDFPVPPEVLHNVRFGVSSTGRAIGRSTILCVHSVSARGGVRDPWFRSLPRPLSVPAGRHNVGERGVHPP